MGTPILKGAKEGTKVVPSMRTYSINKNLSDERALLVFSALRGHEDPKWALEQLEVLGRLAAIKAMEVRK